MHVLVLSIPHYLHIRVNFTSLMQDKQTKEKGVGEGEREALSLGIHRSSEVYKLVFIMIGNGTCRLKVRIVNLIINSVSNLGKAFTKGHMHMFIGKLSCSTGKHRSDNLVHTHSGRLIQCLGQNAITVTGIKGSALYREIFPRFRRISGQWDGRTRQK